MEQSTSDYDKKVKSVLNKIGLINVTKLCDTLQGNVWRALKIANKSVNGSSSGPRSTVIKVTKRHLHKMSISIINGKTFNVHEDILLEQCILKYLSQSKKCPDSIIKFNQFFKSNTNYYLCMEDGGCSLFDFVKNVHQKIQTGEVKMVNWQKVIKIIFKQMIESIDFMHSKNVCHFDISLENFLINDIRVEVENDNNNNNQSVRFLTDNIQIKLCDFGLAQIFTNSRCLSNKHCGKTLYKSPEVMNKKKRFDAKKNDAWSLGVCLFIMITGYPPWKKANESNKAFQFVINGHIGKLLKEWKCVCCTDETLIDLFESIFKYEADRISLSEIKEHPWIK